MSKTDKLLEKLENGSISPAELKTLFKKLGAAMVHQKGSHEVWEYAGRIETFAFKKDLLHYQIKDARRLLGVTNESK